MSEQVLKRLLKGVKQIIRRSLSEDNLKNTKSLAYFIVLDLLCVKRCLRTFTGSLQTASKFDEFMFQIGLFWYVYVHVPLEAACTSQKTE